MNATDQSHKIFTLVEKLRQEQVHADNLTNEQVAEEILLVLTENKALMNLRTVALVHTMQVRLLVSPTLTVSEMKKERDNGTV